MKTKTILFAALTALMLGTSCMTTKTNVGSFRETEGNTYVYAKGKQIWLFWGILPLGRTNVSTPASGSCQVITKKTGVDVLVFALTGGIVSTYTIKVKAKKSNQEK